MLFSFNACCLTVSYSDGRALWEEWVPTAPCFPWEELHCSRQTILQEATARSGIRFLPPLLHLSHHLNLIDTTPELFLILILFSGWGWGYWLREGQVQQNKEEGSICRRSGAGPKSWWVTMSLCISLVAFYVCASQIIYFIFFHQVSMISSFSCWTSTVCTPPSSRSSTSALLLLREEQPMHTRNLRCVGVVGFAWMGMIMYFEHALNYFHDYRRVTMRFQSCQIRVWRWAFFPKKFENWWSVDEWSNS